jgi:Pectate lyase superfamily protein
MAHYNVRDFGARGDGSTMDTACFVQALMKVRDAGAGVVDVPTGRYRLDPLSLPANCTLMGEGARASVLVAARHTESLVTVGNPGAVLSGLGFDSTARQIDHAYVLIQGTFEATLERLHMEKAYIGVALSNSVIVYLDRIGINNFDGCGIHIDGGNDHYLRGIVMNRDPDQAEPIAGIHIIDSDATSISECDIIHAGNCLLITGGRQIYAQNSYFDSGRCGIRILADNSIKRCRFSGCWTSSNLEHGFLIEPAGAANVSDILLIGHHTYFNQLNGIYLGAGDHIQVVGCAGRNNGTPGLYVDPKTSHVTLSGNDLADN